MTAYVGVGSAISLSVSGTNVTSAWIDQKTQWLRCVAIGASAIHVKTSNEAATGNTPPANNVGGTGFVATAQDFVVTNQEPVIIALGQVCSQPVVGIETGVQTFLDFPEGTGSQFVVGQSVNLYVNDSAAGTDQTGFGASVRDVGINTVYTGSVPDGYNSTRVGIDTNTTECPAFLGFHTAFAQLRNNFKVAAIKASGSGPGTLIVQQVSTTMP